MSTPQSTAEPASPRTSAAISRHWPALVGLLGAALVAFGGPNREAVVISLLVALSCYLAAAALGARWVAWAAIPIASVLVTVGAFIGIDPWLTLAGVSVVLIGVGLLLRASRTALAAQSLALVGYGGLGLVALTLGPVPGAVLASLVLIAHGVWDVIHYRRNAVVPRSLAEACIVFDVLVGVAVIFLVLTAL